MPNPYSEDQLVEQPAIVLLETLGWETLDCYGEFDQGVSALGRENKGEVVLTSRLRPALERLNPDASVAAVNAAIEELTKFRAAINPVVANSEIYSLLKDGVKVTDTAPDDDGETVVDLKIIDWENPDRNDFFLASQLWVAGEMYTRRPDDDGETVVDLKIIDWENPDRNDFFLASQLWVAGEMYTRRPDAVGFVNGLPLVLMEFKRLDENVYSAYHDNLRDYKDTIPRLFWYNALIILSNGSESRVGSLTANWEHFAEWKRIEGEDEPGAVSLETILHGLCDHRRLLDIVENFTIFMEPQGGLIKLTAKNHQYLGVNNAIEALRGIESNRGKLGVFWHTQGSGKSVSMLFFAQKVLRKIPGNWTFVVVTDRKELDNQIYKTFASATGVVAHQDVHAENVAHLRQLLREDHRYIFTLIHKFQTRSAEKHPVLSDRSNIVVITDESHRSQYDTLALNMRTALPNAAFIAFTGTPLIAGEHKTRQVFGEYVSIYDFKQSVEDNATVPLYYENRVPLLQLTNEDLNEQLEDILESAALDDEEESKIEQEFARAYHLITRDDRLEAVAEDIVSHFMGRGYQGKAMIISIDKATAVKMYDNVQKHWQVCLKGMKTKLRDTPGDKERKALQATIRYMVETDMAVVISQSQNEIDDLKEKGVNIVPHRARIVAEDLDSKFKDPANPFRIVFVCSMWNTGFDVPSCSTIYLDKPQRNHTLMQTIARANRVFEDKVNGLIVDYIGVFRDLERALAIYASGADGNGTSPIHDKSKLVEQLRETIDECRAFCSNIGADLAGIEAATPFHRIQMIDDAVEYILINNQTKRDYLQLAGRVFRLYKAIMPDPTVDELRGICTLTNIIARKIKSLTEPADISDVLSQIEILLDQSVAPEPYVIAEEPGGYGSQPPVDLSKIDFDKLMEKFKTKHKRIEVEKLRGSINRKLSQMIRLNKTRMDYQEKFEQMIAEYNEGSVDAVHVWEKLIALVEELSEEEQRTIAEQLSEEELTVFDLLTRPEPDLTESEKNKVKGVAKKLLETLKQEKLVLDWRKQQRTRAAVKLSVQMILDELPECYEPEIYDQKCEAVYQHIYESYYGDGNSVYSVAA